MKRMKKKVVAMVTLAMFMMTLLPMAAFAAAANGSYQTSVFRTEKADATVEVGETANTVFEINGTDGNTVAKEDYLKDVVIWATDAQGRVTDAVEVYTEADAETKTDNKFGETIAQVKDGAKYVLSFAREGVYTIHAGVATGNDIEAAEDAELTYVEKYNTVTVTAADAGDITDVVIGDARKVSAKVYNADGTIKPNNTQTKTHEVTVSNANGVAKNETFTITTSSKNIKVTAMNMEDEAFDAGTAVTNRNGSFKISYTVAKEGDYKIYMTSDDGYKVTLNVTTTKSTYPDTIALADFDSAVLNTTDFTSADKDLSDAVRFDIADNNGEELTGATAIAGEPAATPDTDYVKLIAKPDKFKGDAEDFKLVWDGTDEVYTLEYAGTALVKGDYTVRVALDSGNSVDASFTVAEFDNDNIVEMKVVPTSDRVDYTEGSFTYKVVLVDNQGVEKNITAAHGTDYTIGVNAIAGLEAEKVTAQPKVEFTADADDIGQVIKVTAVSDVYEKIATAEVTLTDGNVVEKVAFDKEAGPANKLNTIGVSVVDEDGNVAETVSGDIYAYVVKQSNEDANVEMNVSDKTVTKGENGAITIYSDKETTVDVLVAVKTSKGAIYADTLTFTVGSEEQLGGDTTVVMTLGSTNMIVNNNVVDMKDAAPFAQDNRTFVPFRALGEALGATVEYDQTAKTVTYNLGGTEIVMTLDSKTYTVNGNEKTMDVAPFAKDQRTYVPVRFVGEALGFEVTGLQDANGKYVAVAFTK